MPRGGDLVKRSRIAEIFDAHPRFAPNGDRIRAPRAPLNETPDIVRDTILSPEEIAGGVAELARQIAYQCAGDEVAFVGIHTRGVTLARRVAEALKECGLRYPVGTLDISLYRDDFYHRKNELPKLESSDVPFSLDGIRVILFDEVIFTGRTIRAALDGLMDYGRPAKIELAVLVDRGHRELPIQPDYVVRRIGTTREQFVKVSFREDDNGEEGVFLETPKKVPTA